MSRGYFLQICCLFFLPHLLFASPVYVFKESGGVLKITTKKPPAGVQAKVYTKQTKANFSVYDGARASMSFARYSLGPEQNHSRLFKDRFSSIISSAANRNGIPEELIRAVIHAESSFNPKAVSSKGAMGLMQLIPDNVRYYKIKDPFSPSENIQAGSKLLAGLLRQYSGNVTLALAAYNAGPGNVRKYKGVPPYKETKRYIKKVLQLKSMYASA